MTEGTRPEDQRRSGPPAPDGLSEGWATVGTLLSGIVVWGGAGWLIDRWLGTAAFLPVGVLFGLAAAVYLVYVKAGPAARRPPRTDDLHDAGKDAR